MSEELEQARKVNQALNRRAQEAERRTRVAENMLEAERGKTKWMTEEKMRGRKWMEERGVRAAGRSDWTEVGDLLAEKDRLEAENAAMGRAFADWCQDAEVVRLAVQKERDRCAGLCDAAAERDTDEMAFRACVRLAAAIREGREEP